MSEHEQLSFSTGSETNDKPVVCLGLTFKNDDERRAHFREELRKKLPELKQIEGFPIGEDEDIITLSDPPYYTACPNPWISEILNQKTTDISIDIESVKKPFTSDVSEGKSDRIYKLHSYHTKVPHKAIMKYILHYTQAGDVVFDGFSGTGMTGIASQLCGDENEVQSLGYRINQNNIIVDSNNNIISNFGERHAILNDLSPIATLITNSYNNFSNYTNDFKVEFNNILSKVKKECEWMFLTKHSDGSTGKINYVVWSDVFSCPNCSEELIFWDIAVDNKDKNILKEFNCSHCGSSLKKTDLNRLYSSFYDTTLQKNIQQAKQVPVLINYSINKIRYEKKPDSWDIDLLEKIAYSDIPYWHASDFLPDGYNTAQPITSHGFTHVHHFFTKRNYWVISSFLDKAKKSEYYPYYLNIMRSSSSYSVKMVKVNVPRLLTTGGLFSFGAVSGTLYIPSLNGERPILDAIESKFNSVMKLNLKTSNNYTVTTQNSGDLQNIPNESVDYIFLDPPFGSNLMYSELNYFWESWAKIKTHILQEAIVNSKQDKSLENYKELMIKAFKECYRILKEDKWMTVEFSNSQSSVWNAIRDSIEKAGFIIANVSALDKKQGSFKAVTSTIAVKQDLIISAYKPTQENVLAISSQRNNTSAWIFVDQYLDKLPIYSEHGIVQERTPRILFDRMVAYYVQNSLLVPISSGDFQLGITQRYPMRDGMAFLEQQVIEFDKQSIKNKITQTNLFISDETSAIEWLNQKLIKKPQTRQDLHLEFMKEIQHISKHEKLPELDDLLTQNFLRYDSELEVPSQIVAYFRRNHPDLRGLEPSDEKLKQKAMNRWYVPDPNKQADLEKLREKSLLREFNLYVDEMTKSKKKLKEFRTEAIRAGFKKAWSEKDYQTIVDVGNRLPETVIQEDDKLLMYFDNAQIKLGL